MLLLLNTCVKKICCKLLGKLCLTGRRKALPNCGWLDTHENIVVTQIWVTWRSMC